MELFGLIALSVPLAMLRWRARPLLVWMTLVATLSAPLLGIMPSAHAAVLSDPAFTNVLNVSANTGNSNYPQIASKQDSLFTVWVDGTNVLYRRITIAGAKPNPDALQAITNFGPNEDAAVSPQIATDPAGADDNVYVAWTQTRAGHIWLKRSTDGGLSFGSTIQISNGSGTVFAPRIAVAGKFVAVAWGDFTDTGFAADDKPGCPGSGGGVSFDLSECRFSIYVALSQDGGATFGTPYNVSGRPSANGVPAIAAAPLTAGAASIYVTWPGISREMPLNNIFFANSDNNGVGWAYARECPGEPGKLRCSDVYVKHPQVAASANGDVYVAWSEKSSPTGQDGDDDVHIVVSRNRGLAFDTAFNLSHSPGGSDYPDLAISNSGVQVVWHDGSTGVMDVFHSRSLNGATDFSERRNIGLTTFGYVYRPRVAASGDNVHIVWSDGFDTFYALSTDNGLSFDSYQLSATNDKTNALHPRLAPNGSFVAAAWDQGSFEPIFNPLPRGERDVYVDATTANHGDLMLAGLDAVQGPFAGKVLAKGKPTLLRVQVQNGFFRNVNTKLKVFYDSVVHGTLTSVTRTVPVTLTPGVNTFYLPGDEFIAPDGPDFHATAIVDPDNEIEEVDETNNMLSMTPVPIRDTGTLRVLYWPLKLASDTAGPTCDDVRRTQQTSDRYIRAMFPIDPDKLQSWSYCNNYEPSLQPRLNGDAVNDVLAALEERAKLGDVDVVVAVVPPRWFATHTTNNTMSLGMGEYGPSGHAAIVEAQFPDVAGFTTAHEIAHNLGWVMPGYPNADPTDSHHIKPAMVSGYWVTERREVKGEEFMQAVASGSRSAEPWVSPDSYTYLANALMQLNLRVDPKVIMIRGAIARNGAMTLAPWYRFESLLDVPLDNPGAYMVDYLDGAGQSLGHTGFDVSSGEISDGGGVSSTIPFTRLIPDVPGTKKIVLRQGSQVLAQRVASPNAPTIHVLSPNGGERFNPGDTVKVTWESADADGDALTHAVMFSRDGGQTWAALAHDISGQDYSFTLNETDASKDARVRVLVTDGFNGAEDSSDAGFSIGGASHGLEFGAANIVRDNVTAWTIMATARTAASGDNVYAVWSERTCQPGCSRADVLFRRSRDAGTTFDPLVKLSTNGNPNETPYVAVSGNTVYVVWNEDVGHIALRRSIDGGATFDPMVTLTTNGSFPQLVAAGDSVYVVWQAALTLPSAPFFQSDVFFVASADRGVTFGPALNVSDSTTRESTRPQLAVAGSNVYVAWHEAYFNSALGNTEVMVRRSVNGGTTFDPAVNLGGNALPLTYGPGTTAYEIVDAVRLAVSGNELYVAWRDYTNYRAAIDFTHSVDAGATFAPVVPLSQPLRNPWFTQLAVSAGQVYVAWTEGADGNDQGIGTTDVLFRVSSNGGVSFAPETILSTSQGRALFPHLVAQGNTVNLVWQHDVPLTNLPWEAVFRQSTDRGQSFAAPLILGTEQGQTGYPQLAVTPAGNVYATWLGDYGYKTNSRDYRYLAMRAGTVGLGSDNRAPAANAGTDRTVTEGSTVALVGLGSDPDGDRLTYAWQQIAGPAVVLSQADTATAAFTAPVGSAGSVLTFQLTVNDGRLASAPSAIRISVIARPPIIQAPWLSARNLWEDRSELPTPIVLGQQDTTPPVTTATVNGTLGNNGWYKAGQLVQLTLSATDDLSGVASTSYAVNGGARQTYAGPVTFTDGVYTVTYGSVDKAGNVETPKSVSFKVDQTAPSFTACALDPPQLWPPNHKMVNVTASVVVADSGSGSAGFVLKSAVSNEPDNGLGDGDTANDIQGFVIGTPDTQGQLRAERSGLGTGRVYTLTYQAVDAAGNVQTCNATTKVPHDQGPGNTAQSERSPIVTGPPGQASASNAVAVPMIFQASGPIAASLQSTIDAFRSALGSDNGNEAGPLPSGRREIDWDGDRGDQATVVVANPFAGYAVSRGAVFATPDGTAFMQAPAAADPVRFPPGGFAGLYDDATYGTLLRPFSASRLFSAIGGDVAEVDFFVPGRSAAPATTRGFGVVFTGSVGDPNEAPRIDYFGADDNLLFSSAAAPSPGEWGLSFFGIVFDDARIAWVRITSAGAAAGPDQARRHRIVVMDDVIYGEPQPMPSDLRTTR